MKYISLFLLLLTVSILSQGSGFKNILARTQSDSSNKVCQKLFDDIYDSFESDEGTANPRLIKSMQSLMQLQGDENLPNHELAALLYKYFRSVPSPDSAVKIMDELLMKY